MVSEENLPIYSFTKFDNTEYHQQDTTIVRPQNVIQQDTAKKSNTNPTLTTRPQIKSLDLQAIDSIMRISAEREQQIIQEAQRPKYRSTRYRKKDTANLLYSTVKSSDLSVVERHYAEESNQNFLLNFQSLKSEAEIESLPVYVDESGESTTSAVKEIGAKPLKIDTIDRSFQFDWITGLIVFCILLIGWVRLFYNKYLGLVFRSLVSYKDALTILREKNSLTQRASLVMNGLFCFSSSVFAIQVFSNYNLALSGLSVVQTFFIFLAFFFALYLFRGAASGFIGFVFLQQKTFQEYFHNQNIFNKNIGLFLVPVIILLQFLTYEVELVLIVTSLGITGIIYVLKVFRSFEIFARKKVSLLYMILYLCAFEIAPFLLIYKSVLLLVD